MEAIKTLVEWILDLLILVWAFVSFMKGDLQLGLILLVLSYARANASDIEYIHNLVWDIDAIKKHLGVKDSVDEEEPK